MTTTYTYENMEQYTITTDEWLGMIKEQIIVLEKSVNGYTVKVFLTDKESNGGIVTWASLLISILKDDYIVFATRTDNGKKAQTIINDWFYDNLLSPSDLFMGGSVVSEEKIGITIYTDNGKLQKREKVFSDTDYIFWLIALCTKLERAGYIRDNCNSWHDAIGNKVWFKTWYL